MMTNDEYLNDFAVFILTHGRPDRVITYKKLKEKGYTGKIYLIIDDSDKEKDLYLETYKDEVIVFNKAEAAKLFETADNFKKTNTVVYARNECFRIAKNLKLKYFLQLDDDYTEFNFRFNNKKEYNYKKIKKIDPIFKIFLDFLKSTPIHSIAFAQGGDFIGGEGGTYAKKIKLFRKCMNSFFCKTDAPFKFIGTINEDVNTYTYLASLGYIFFTSNYISLQQIQTQQNSGGLTDFYLLNGTYVKSFYSVLFHPSSIVIRFMNSLFPRLHHSISWNNTVPKILSQEANNKKPIQENINIAKNSYKDISFFSKKSNEDLKELINGVAKYFSVNNSDILKLQKDTLEMIKLHSSNRVVSDLNKIMILQNRWYDSIKNNTPDYSVYSDFYYLGDVWACWKVYSSNSVKTINKPHISGEVSLLSMVDKEGLIVDLGCGISYTTVALKELFPNAVVIGTNLEGTWQYKYAEELSAKHGFQLLNKVPSSKIELVFASEYFEHLERPLEHLRDIINICSPNYFVIANGFNGTSIGHFNSYKDKNTQVSNKTMSKLFWLELKKHGYIKLKTNIWNNRPSYWKRVQS